MASGALRGAASAWLGLIVLSAVVSRGGSGKVAGLFDVVSSGVEKALSPSVPAIPDFAGGAGGGTSSSTNRTPAPLTPGVASLPGTAVIPTTPRMPIPGVPIPH